LSAIWILSRLRPRPPLARDNVIGIDSADNNSNSNPFYHFSSKVPTITDSEFNCRAIFFNERLWIKLSSSLLDLLKDMGPLVVYELGLECGHDLGLQGKDRTKNEEDVIDLFTNYAMMSGWGRFELSLLKAKSGKTHPRKTLVKVYDSFFVKAKQSQTGNPCCFFVCGLLAGFAEGIFSICYNCIEDRCVGAGDDHCEFVLTRRSSD
jgi:predicted hydrocarbon binding protein